MKAFSLLTRRQLTSDHNESQHTSQIDLKLENHPGFLAGVCGKAQLLASGNALEVHGKATAAQEMHHFRENAYLHP